MPISQRKPMATETSIKVFTVMSSSTSVRADEPSFALDIHAIIRIRFGAAK